MRVKIALIAVLLFSPPSYSIERDQCGDLVNKIINQLIHAEKGNLWNFRRLHYLLGKYPRSTRWINLSELKHLHPIDYPNSFMLKKLDARITELKLHPDMKAISLAEQQKIIPSKNGIVVILDDDGRYVVQDGNSRLFALKSAFPNQDIRIEVNEIQVRDKNPEVYKLIHRIRNITKLSD